MKSSARPQLRTDLRLSSLVAGKAFDDGREFEVLDKYDGRVVARVTASTREHVSVAAQATRMAYEKGAPAPVDRAKILRGAADALQSRRNEFIDVMVAETGFTLADAAGDVDRTVVTLSLCAEEATRVLGETVAFAASPGQHNRIGFTIRVPLGVVCAITPFNSPLNTVAHKIGPALAAGNAVILKPSGTTPVSAALLCRLLLDAGLPAGLLAVLHDQDGSAGAWLLEEPRIAFYSFTGSTRVGRIIKTAAGLRPTQLELGSIASTIVCDDGDLERAVPKIANASFRKAGQVCTSTQRLYVHERVRESFTDRLAAAAAAMPAGDPRDPSVRIGPMISEQAARRAEQWIDDAKLGQARVVQGGMRKGPVLQPTILTNVKKGMKVIDEEIFAPVVSIMPFSDLEEAIAEANDTPFGLSVGIFTADLDRGMRAARGLRFGAVHINEASSARADGMPFGGVKDSGHGREGPKYAILELTEERLVTLNT